MIKLLYHSLQNKPYTINYETLNKDISNWEIVLPPLEEQELIVKELKSLDDLISKNIMNREGVIEKLMEYKKSLIYEVVTGKKEV